MQAEFVWGLPVKWCVLICANDENLEGFHSDGPKVSLAQLSFECPS